MTINDVKRFYGVKTNIELANKLKMTNVTMTNWHKNGIPYAQQCVFYFESKHALKPTKGDENGNDA